MTRRFASRAHRDSERTLPPEAGPARQPAGRQSEGLGQVAGRAARRQVSEPSHGSETRGPEGPAQGSDVLERLGQARAAGNALPSYPNPLAPDPTLPPWITPDVPWLKNAPQDAPIPGPGDYPKPDDEQKYS